MIHIDQREFELIIEQISIDESGNKPSYYPVCASYIRSFPQNRHTATSDDMPKDKQLTHAVRTLYRDGTPEERAVMTRMDYDGMTAKDRKRIFNELVYRLARLAGLTAYTLSAETKGREPNESD